MAIYTLTTSTQIRDEFGLREEQRGQKHDQAKSARQSHTGCLNIMYTYYTLMKNKIKQIIDM